MRVAIIGGGISGLVAAHLLSRDHEVVVFEAADRIGGHTHTHKVHEGERTLAVDSGFIVFNEHNYPNFTRLLASVGVSWKPSDMGFSVRDDRDDTEYSGRSLDHVFAQRRNLLKPSFHAMVFDLLRFYREAPRLKKSFEGETLGTYLRRRRYRRRFIEQHILPMGAALWSCSESQMLNFPVRFFVEFMDNHRMLQLRGRPEWQVVEGGSSSYLGPLTAPFADNIRLSHPVRGVRRSDDGAQVTSPSGEEHFDQVVLACHSDQALLMLEDPSDAEREVLGAMPYSKNETLLHTDASVMPKERKVWSAWNYHVRSDRGTRSSAALTYHMNTLQGLRAREEYCVTLNDSEGIDASRVLARMDYEHPQYDLGGAAARDRWAEISGVRHTHYAGAYWGWGFHEDGVSSALRAVQKLEPKASL